MSTNRPTTSNDDDDVLSDNTCAAIERALAEPGITLSAQDIATLLAGSDDEVCELLATGRVAEALGVARFNVAETTFGWDEPRNRPLPFDVEPL